MKIVVFTLGCKVNQYESDALLAKLEDSGYQVSEKLEVADVYVLNTCAVTSEAERKSRQSVTRVLNINPNAKIIVCGCASENNFEQFSSRSEVLYVSGVENKMKVCEIIDKFNKSQQTLFIEKLSSSKNEKSTEKTLKNLNFENNKSVNKETKNEILSAEKNENLTVNYENTESVNKETKNEILSAENSNYKIEKANQRQNDNINCSEIVDIKEIGCVFEEMGKSKSPRTRHYIKIQDGCNNFCSYCLIPYLRGRSRSRKIENILDEVQYACSITKEIVLTGINLSAYGKDIGSSLSELMLALKDFDIRIRLGSLEVGAIDKKLLEATKQQTAFCDHFHLSLQSGDDNVLKSMNRHYNTYEFKKAVELIREYYPNAAITTDVIVGFPTETDEYFQNSKKFVEEIGFADVHIFTYSPRERTVAAKLPQIDKQIALKRHKELEKVKFELRDKYNSKFLNTKQEVLFESKRNGYYAGHTKNYITVYKEEAKKGEILSVECTKLFKDGLM